MLKYKVPGHYYLIFSYMVKKKTGKEEAPDRTTAVALDPGVHTFQAGYDSKGCFSEFGSSGITHMFKYGKRMDQLHSKIDRHHKEAYADHHECVQYKNQ